MLIFYVITALMIAVTMIVIGVFIGFVGGSWVEDLMP